MLESWISPIPHSTSFSPPYPHENRRTQRLRPAGVERDALKDDIKIIAQAAVADAEFVITDDTESFYRYCKTLKDAGEVQFKAIKLEDGFDRAFFDPNGQRDFTDGLDEGNGGQS